jgi:hypothetical protein
MRAVLTSAYIFFGTADVTLKAAEKSKVGCRRVGREMVVPQFETNVVGISVLLLQERTEIRETVG